MGQSPPLILQLTFALVTIQEASATLGGKSVKCDVTKIPFKINNDQLSPSHRYLGEKFYSLKELMDSLCTHVLVLHAKGRLHPRITAVLAASTHLKIPHPADAVPISLFSEISYPMRVLVFWLCSFNSCVCKMSLWVLNSLLCEFNKRKWTRSGFNTKFQETRNCVHYFHNTAAVVSKQKLSQVLLVPVTPTGRSCAIGVWPAVPETPSLKTASGTPSK